MLIGVYGDVGSGKNVLVVYLLSKIPEIMKYVNFKLKLPNSHKVDTISLFNLEDTGKQIIVVWDEAYTEMDNRVSLSDLNRINSYLLFQSRKRNMTIISISQLNILDIRWKGLEKYAIIGQTREIYDKNGEDSKEDFNYVITNGVKIVQFKLEYKNARTIFDCYDTRETILPHDLDRLKEEVECQDPKKLNVIIDKYINIITKKYSEIGDRITHDWLKDKMLRLCLNLHYEPYVYVRMRCRNQ